MLLLILALAIGNLPKEVYACRGKNSFLDNSVCESWFMAVRVLASALKALPLPSNNACQVGAALCPMLICQGQWGTSSRPESLPGIRIGDNIRLIVENESCEVLDDSTYRYPRESSVDAAVLRV